MDVLLKSPVSFQQNLLASILRLHLLISSKLEFYENSLPSFLIYFPLRTTVSCACFTHIRLWEEKSLKRYTVQRIYMYLYCSSRSNDSFGVGVTLLFELEQLQCCKFSNKLHELKTLISAFRNFETTLDTLYSTANTTKMFKYMDMTEK